jgi:hypothetical protein
VSQQNAALSGAINVPVDPAIAKSLKTVVREARQVVHEKIDQSSDRGADQKSIDRNFAELIFACLDDVAGMSVFDSFVRTWSNGDGTLTTVGAVQISDGEKYRELVRKFPTREGVERNATGEAGVEIHKVVVTQWRKDYQELFDRDGSVFIGTSDTALWYAFGEKARDRLEQTIHEAKENSGTKTEAAVTVHARMLPLVEVWEKIHARRPAAGAAKPKAKNEKKEEPVATRAVSTVAELNLPKIAAEAYRGGHDEISLSLSRHGPKAVWSARFDEGTLRFIGKTLSKFVKDNLED